MFQARIFKVPEGGWYTPQTCHPQAFRGGDDQSVLDV